MIRNLVLAVAVLVWALPASADSFTSAEFLKWKPESQIAYFRDSVGMANVIATQSDKALARCINDWHVKQNAAGYPALKEATAKYPDYHPQAVILWQLQKECGKFSPSK